MSSFWTTLFGILNIVNVFFNKWLYQIFLNIRILSKVLLSLMFDLTEHVLILFNKMTVNVVDFERIQKSPLDCPGWSGPDG